LIGLYDADHISCSCFSIRPGWSKRIYSICVVLYIIVAYPNLLGTKGYVVVVVAVYYCHLINNNKPLISIFGCLT
jgi:hypothetical protein